MLHENQFQGETVLTAVLRNVPAHDQALRDWLADLFSNDDSLDDSLKSLISVEREPAWQRPRPGSVRTTASIPTRQRWDNGLDSDTEDNARRHLHQYSGRTNRYHGGQRTSSPKREDRSGQHYASHG